MSVPTSGLAEWQKRRKALQALATPTQQAPSPVQDGVSAGAPALPNASIATASAPAAPSAPSAPAAPGVQQAAVNQTPAAPTVQAPTPQQTQAASSWQGNGAPDPRDAQYWSDVAKSMNTRDVGLAQTQLQEQQNATAKARALEDLARGHNVNQRTLRQKGSSRGALYSTSLGMELSDEQEATLRSTFRTEEDYAQAQNALAVQRQALESGFSVEEAAALAAASYRYAQDQMSKQALAAQLAALQPPAPEPAPAPAAPAYTPQQQQAIASGWTPQQAQGGAGPPGPHYVWSPQQLRWVYTGPSPGKNYYWTGVAWKKR